MIFDTLNRLSHMLASLRPVDHGYLISHVEMQEAAVLVQQAVQEARALQNESQKQHR